MSYICNLITNFIVYIYLSYSYSFNPLNKLFFIGRGLPPAPHRGFCPQVMRLLGRRRRRRLMVSCLLSVTRQHTISCAMPRLFSLRHAHSAHNTHSPTPVAATKGHSHSLSHWEGEKEHICPKGHTFRGRHSLIEHCLCNRSMYA